jgi:hypothetical protein
MGMKKEPANWIGLLLILTIVAVITLAIHAVR